MVVAVDAGMQGHHQAVVDGHPGHLEEHVLPERGDVGRVTVRRRGRAQPVEQRPRLRRVQLQGGGGHHAVVGGDRAVGDEVGPPVRQRGEVAGVPVMAVAGGRDQLVHRRGPGGGSGREVPVRAEGGDHPTAQRRLRRRGEAGVRGQRVERVVRRREHLDAEPAEQAARPVVRPPQHGGDLVEEGVRVARRRLPDAEDVVQFAGDPVAAGGAGERRPARAEGAPDVPCRRLRGRPQPVQSGPVGMQQPGDVVVRGDEERSRVRERHVVGEQVRVDVAVRGQDRCVFHEREQLPRHRPDVRVGGEESIGVCDRGQGVLRRHGDGPPACGPVRDETLVIATRWRQPFAIRCHRRARVFPSPRGTSSVRSGR